MNALPARFRAAVVGAAIAMAGAAQAAPVQFEASPATFTAGAGYGVDASEATGTLLDVTFAATTGLSTFLLGSPGDSASFVFGNITLSETGTINANETDNLGVLASFLFVDPLLGLSNVIASGTATVGLVGDLAIDLVINWVPTLVSFGDGGLFSINLSTSRFNASGQTREVTATITLIDDGSTVPEPTTLALTGLALAGLGLGSRKKRAAVSA